MRVLLRAKSPYFSNWGIELLTNQVWNDIFFLEWLLGPKRLSPNFISNIRHEMFEVKFIEIPNPAGNLPAQK